MQLKHVFTIALILIISNVSTQDIKLEKIDPKSIKMESIDLKSGKNQFNIAGLKGVIVKVYFREKYLKKQEIEVISAELEELLADAEVEYQNLNIRDQKYIWILCNGAEERAQIREILLAKENILVIESDGKKYFGKFASQKEKEKWREAKKIEESSKKLDL